MKFQGIQRLLWCLYAVRGNIHKRLGRGLTFTSAWAVSSHEGFPRGKPPLQKASPFQSSLTFDQARREILWSGCLVSWLCQHALRCNAWLVTFIKRDDWQRRHPFIALGPLTRPSSLAMSSGTYAQVRCVVGESLQQVLHMEAWLLLTCRAVRVNVAASIYRDTHTDTHRGKGKRHHCCAD